MKNIRSTFARFRFLKCPASRFDVGCAQSNPGGSRPRVRLGLLGLDCAKRLYHL